MRWLASLLVWLWPLPLFAQGAASLVSDSLTLGPGPVLSATGHVEVLYGDARLTATALTYDQAADSLTIAGPMVLTDGTGTILLADSATLDPDLRNGILRGARMILDRQVQLAAGRIDRVDGRFTALTRVAATSCQVCAGRPPVWEIRAGEVIHDTEERQLYFRDATLRLGGVPVFWLPRMRLPDPTLDRASGFLIPRLRSTDLLGLGLRMPYFLRLGDHRDLTVTPYVSPATRTVELSYRQAFATGDLSVQAAVSRDDVRAGTTRGYLIAAGAFALPRDWRLTFDLEWVSDETYLLDYGHGDRDRLDSQLALVRVRADSLLRADLTEYTSLRPGEVEGSLPPLIGAFDGQWRLAPTFGGTLTLQAGAEAFWRNTPGTGDAARDVARAGVGAHWETSLTFGPGVILTAQAGIDADIYRTGDDPDQPAWATTARPAAQVALRWPLVRHGARATDVLEPLLALNWSGRLGDAPLNEDSRFVEWDEGNLGALTRFPGEDAAAEGLSLVLGATWSRLAADGRSFALTFGRILRDRDSGFALSTGLATARSDWLLAGRLDLGDGFALRARTLLGDNLDFGKTEARLSWQGARVALDAAYVWLPADAAEDRTDALSEWTLDAAYQVSDRWEIRADGRYDVAADRPAQAGFGIRWRNECVTVDLSVSRRYTSAGVDDPRTDFGLSVALDGFSTGSGPGLPPRPAGDDMRGRGPMRAGWRHLLAVAGLIWATACPAQSPFSPAITVNDSVITRFELDQRALLLELFRQPGDLAELAREGLIEDRLKMQELARVGLRLSDESLATAMEEFAGRANLPLDQFLTLLAQNGVEEATLRDFVEVGISWRDYVRERFGPQVTITDDDIDQALGAAGGNGTVIEVLLSEIIIPAPPPEADRVLTLARDIAETRSTDTFESAARQYSALPSRANGGRLDWVPVGNFPEALRPLLLALAPGEVTAPIQIEGGVALFQMRDVREVAGDAPAIARIDYAVYLAADAQDAANATARTDTCDDLFGVAQGLPADRLIREDVAPDVIPQDIGLLLAGLDRDEWVIAPGPGGGVRVVMLCNRTAAAVADVDRDAIRDQLRSQRLGGFAAALLADLRAAAVITTP